MQIPGFNNRNPVFYKRISLIYQSQTTIHISLFSALGSRALFLRELAIYHITPLQSVAATGF